MSLPTLEEFKRQEVLPYTGVFDPVVCTYDDLEGLLLFSGRRKLIWQHFLPWQTQMKSLFGPVRFWLNGSFVTAKENPNDIDVVAIAPRDLYGKVLTSYPDECKRLLTHPGPDKSRCQPAGGFVDAFIVPDGSDRQLAYWDKLWSTVNVDKHYISKEIEKKRYVEVREP